ncbi:hypothetical protein [Pelotomaculum schinkii]|nr:hypothetical protein [Pelotomaculum schinkii]
MGKFVANPYATKMWRIGKFVADPYATKMWRIGKFYVKGAGEILFPSSV